MRFKAPLLALLVVVSMVGAAAAPAAAQEADGEAYSGANIEFETTGNAVADYAVGGDVLVENVTMQSAGGSEGGFDAGLESTTDIDAAGLELDTQARASATLTAESGAEMEAHDNQRGILQVRAADSGQVVNAEVGSDAEAESDGDSRVVVSNENGSQGTFIVVGDGDVAVNEEGDVNADLEQGSQLVYRQYDGERSDNDEQTEEMIANGTATAEVYVQQSQDGGEETVADAVEYGEDTTIEVASASENQVNMTAERSESEGKVVVTSVSEEAFSSAEDVEVFVDGNATAEADSYSEVRQSASEGDQPRYYVSQSSSAEATTDVAVGIDHFSERQVSMQSDGEGGSDGSIGDGAGFGPVVALLAVVGSLLAARRIA